MINSTRFGMLLSSSAIAITALSAAAPAQAPAPETPPATTPQANPPQTPAPAETPPVTTAPGATSPGTSIPQINVQAPRQCHGASPRRDRRRAPERRARDASRRQRSPPPVQTAGAGPGRRKYSGGPAVQTLQQRVDTVDRAESRHKTRRRSPSRTWKTFRREPISRSATLCCNSRALPRTPPPKATSISATSTATSNIASTAFCCPMAFPDSRSSWIRASSARCR